MAEQALQWIIGLSSAAGAVQASKSIDMPKPQKVEKPDTAGAEMAAEDAERRKAAQKKGYLSTILTSGNRLGKAPTKRKTLLGE